MIPFSVSNCHRPKWFPPRQKFPTVSQWSGTMSSTWHGLHLMFSPLCAGSPPIYLLQMVLLLNMMQRKGIHMWRVTQKTNEWWNEQKLDPQPSGYRTSHRSEKSQRVCSAFSLNSHPGCDFGLLLPHPPPVLWSVLQKTSASVLPFDPFLTLSMQRHHQIP